MYELTSCCVVYREVFSPVWETKNFLSLAERSVFHSLVSERRRGEWLASRIAAKHAVSRTLLRHAGIAINPFAIEVYSGLQGDPLWRVINQQKRAFKALPTINLSLAHTQRESLAVGSIYPIGVDIESIRSVKEEVMQYFLSKNEIRIIKDNFPSLSCGSVVLWTLKEATVKCMRTGFGVALKSVRITHITKQQAVIEMRLRRQSVARFFGRYQYRNKSVISLISPVDAVTTLPLYIMDT